MDRLSSARKKLIICLCLVLMTGVIFGIAVTFDFVNYDDPDYVTDNYRVRSGLSMRGVAWAFTTILQYHWHPLTLLSHMLDCQLFGLNPAGHHFTSILFHIFNTILLFVVLERMSKALWPSALVAALFALHPLHVESVVWITSRKDVLSTFFMLATLWVYVSYTARPGIGIYFLMLFLFALGLLAKSILVTLPFIMWLLDYWPLGRWTAVVSEKKGHNLLWRVWHTRILWEKLPFLFLSMMVSIITFFARQTGSGNKARSYSPSEDSLTESLIDAVNGYSLYIWKMFWPANLSTAYQVIGPAPIWQFFLSFVLLVGISFLCLMTIKRRPYLMVGWLWFLGMLVPVAGIFIMGPNLGADRYTYVPLIGLFIMLSWSILELRGRGPRIKRLTTHAMVLILAACSILSVKQLRYWKDSTTLFSRAIAVNPDNSAAQLLLGLTLYKADNKHKALEHLKRAVQLAPGNANIQQNIASVFSDMGHYEKAIEHLSKAVRISPNHKKARIDLAICLAQTGDFGKANEHFIEAIKLATDDPDAYYKYGYTLGHQKEYRESFEQMKKVLDIDPEYTKHYDLARGIKLYEDDKLLDAERLLKDIVRRFPKESKAYLYLGLIASSKGDLDSAVSYLRSAIKAAPGYTKAHVNLGIALAGKKEYSKADEAFSEALKLKPNHVQAHYNYAASLYLQHRDKEAMEELTKTLKIDPDYKEARRLLNTMQMAN